MDTLDLLWYNVIMILVDVNKQHQYSQELTCLGVSTRDDNFIEASSDRWDSVILRNKQKCILSDNGGTWPEIMDVHDVFWEKYINWCDYNVCSKWTRVRNGQVCLVLLWCFRMLYFMIYCFPYYLFLAKLAVLSFALFET